MRVKAEGNSATEFQNWIEAELVGIRGNRKEFAGIGRNSGIAGTDSVSMQFRNSVPQSVVYFRGYSRTIYIVDSVGEGRRQFRHGIPELDRSGIGGNSWELVGIGRNW